MTQNRFLHLLWGSALLAVVYADFISNLTSHSFQVLTPGSSGYPAASAACKLVHSVIHPSLNFFPTAYSQPSIHF